MLKKKLESFLKEYKELIIHSKNKKIQNEIQLARDNFDEDEFEVILNMVISELITDIDEFENDKDIEENIAENLSIFIEASENMNKNCVFKISLAGLDNEIYRIISVPSFFPLSAFGYVILSSMNASGEHLFRFIVDHEQYVCDLEDNDCEKASIIFFESLTLYEGKFMQMIYDYGENYEFNIEFLGNKSSSKFIEVLDGKGLGIIEDNKEKLYGIYQNGKNIPKKYSYFDKEENEFEIVSEISNFAKMYGEDIQEEDHFGFEQLDLFKGNQA